MSHGILINVGGVGIRLDSSYTNMVLAGKISISLGAGYSTVNLTAFANPNMICAVRHPGCSASFIGYTYSGANRVGVKIYSHTGGTFHFACYLPFYPIYNAPYGTIVNDASGVMRFHSEHNYMDAVTSGSLAAGAIAAGSNYYIMANATYPNFTYDVHRLRESMIGTGGLNKVTITIRCTKTIGYVWQAANGVLSRGTVLILNNAVVKVHEFITYSPFDDYFGTGGPAYDDVKGWVPPANAPGGSVVIIQ